MKKNAIKNDINDLSAWYQEVVSAADLAEHSPVRGCMVIRPWGYAIWERMQAVLDREFKKRSVENIYCPLFIPLSFFEKEAKHVDGFAKECAVVTHHRLSVNNDGKLVPSPDAELTEPLVVRPTSEAIMGHMFAKWIESYRDLPLCINQWANVVRWEMRTRLFLRTSEFLWQEGHTAHADQESARTMSYDMIVCYKNFLEEYLSIAVVLGEKCASERFAGADVTWTVEALMPDAKALQSGTSHFLAQNFSKAFDIKFVNQLGKIEHVWTTSWGVTTRLIGSMIMSHGDQNGLRVPPRISPYHVVILPIIKDGESREEVEIYLDKITTILDSVRVWSDPLRYFIDKKNLSQGDKKWSWIKKGCPIILELGMRDIADNICVVTSRYDLTKNNYDLNKLPDVLIDILENTHKILLSESHKNLINQIKVIYVLDDLDLDNNKNAYLLPWDDGIESFLQDSTWSVRCLLDKDSAILKELHVENIKGQWALIARSY